KKRAWQNGCYAEAEQQLSPQLTLKYGLRFNTFNRLGQKKINRYENNQPVRYNQHLGIYEEAPILNSYRKSNGKTIKAYYNVEPRASISYKFNDDNDFKASYQRMHQYLQILNNSNSPNPYNTWA